MYQHILAAVDFSDECAQVVARAIELQKQHSAHLHLVHVVEPISHTYIDVVNYENDIRDNLNRSSEQQLGNIVENNELSNVTASTLNGRAATEIHDYAEANQIDLIVTGSHGTHGLQLLLGSTANGILHGANCDVLAVRIKE